MYPHCLSRQHSSNNLASHLPIIEMHQRWIADSECFALPEALLTYRAGFLTCRSSLDFPFSFHRVNNGLLEVVLPAYSGRTVQAWTWFPLEQHHSHSVRQIWFTQHKLNTFPRFCQPFFVQFVFFFIFPYFYFDISRSILKNSKIPILWCYQLLIRNRRAKWLSVWPNAASQLIRSGLYHSWYK